MPAQLPAQTFPPEPAADRHGWYAVNLIRQEGHDLLGQFVVSPDGKAVRVQSDRFVKAIASFFTSGVRALETRHDMGGEITTGDMFWAGIDVALIAAPLKLFRAGKMAARSGEELSLASRTRVFAPQLLARGKFFRKLGTFGALAATAYVVVTHPSLINSVLGEAARLLGLNPLLVQFVGWTLIISLLLYPFSWLLKILARATLAGLAWINQSRRRHGARVASGAGNATVR